MHQKSIKLLQALGTIFIKWIIGKLLLLYSLDLDGCMWFCFQKNQVTESLQNSSINV